MVGTQLQWHNGRSWILTLIGLVFIVSTLLLGRVYVTRARTYESISCGKGKHVTSNSQSHTVHRPTRLDRVGGVMEMGGVNNGQLF